MSAARSRVRSREPLKVFEKSVGGRQALAGALELCVLDGPQTQFLALMCDPKRRMDSLKTLCDAAGVSPGTIIDMFRSASFATAHAISVGIISRGMPAVTQDTVDKAVDMVITCPICQGEERDSDNLCKRCYGVGTVLRLADFDRQRMIFEAAGLLKKEKSGTSVQIGIQQTVGQIPVPVEFMSSFVKNSDDLAYAVEGKVVAEKEQEQGSVDP